MASLKLIDKHGKPDESYDRSFIYRGAFTPYGLKQIPDGCTLTLYECFDAKLQSNVALKGEVFFNHGKAKARISPDRYAYGDTVSYRAVLHMESTDLNDFVKLYEKVMDYLGCKVINFYPLPPPSFILGIRNDLRTFGNWIKSKFPWHRGSQNVV